MNLLCMNPFPYGVLRAGDKGMLQAYLTGDGGRPESLQSCRIKCRTLALEDEQQEDSHAHTHAL